MAKTDSFGVKLELRKHFYKPFPDPLEMGIAVLKSGAPFPEVAASLGLSKTVFLVAVMVQNFCSQFNFGPGKNMNQGQIEDLAGELVLDFVDRKGTPVMLEEIAIFFDKALGMKRKDGRSFVFDRVDKMVILEMMDYYFEADRTWAVWAIEDERENKKRTIPPADDFRTSREGGSAEPKSIGEIYTDLAGQPGRLPLAKLIKEAEKKFKPDAEQ